MKYRLLTIGCWVAMFFSAQCYARQQVQWIDEVDLQQYQDQVIYIDFWASWCGPCRHSFPWLNSMQEKYEARGLVVIAVNLDRDIKMAQRFLSKVPADFLLFSDTTGSLAKTYALEGMPSAYIFDGDGQLRSQHVGFKKSDREQYENSIVTLLDELNPVGVAK